MKIIEINENVFSELPPTAAMIGTFDGFHKGHQQLIESTLEQARTRDIESALILFDPDPTELLSETHNPKILSLTDRMQLAEQFGFDNVYLCSFTREFADMGIESFHTFLKNLNILILIYGFDFTYGKGGEGNAESLAGQHDFEVMEVNCLPQNHKKISSSRIRENILDGKMLRVCQLLGYCYSIPGFIDTGFQRGSRLLGFPTANLKWDDGYILPKKGVYAGHVLLNDQAYPAMINVGYNPTFNNERPTIEANIFDFDRDIYGQPSRFFFEYWLRDEIPFESVDALIRQLENDRDTIKRVLKEVAAEWSLTRELWRINS